MIQQYVLDARSIKAVILTTENTANPALQGPDSLGMLELERAGHREHKAAAEPCPALEVHTILGSPSPGHLLQPSQGEAGFSFTSQVFLTLGIQSCPPDRKSTV